MRPRVCVIGAGPCGLAAVKNLLQAGCRDVVCFDESDQIGGNWAYTEDPGRATVHNGTHIISSRRLSAFEDFPMPGDYPDFPSHRQMLAYFTEYAEAFGVLPHVRLGWRVEGCERDGDGRWTVRIRSGGRSSTERFDAVLVCSGHHRDPYLPDLPGTFSGTRLHSSVYKRPEPFAGQRVLVVGAGNSAADIAVDLSRVARRTVLSLRAPTYVVPKLVFGHPVDAVFAYWRLRLPRPLLRSALRLWLRAAVGPWHEYGLAAPTAPPLAKPPTLSSALLDALRHGRVEARPGIDRCDGATVRFVDGTADEFDTVVLATGFRARFPFLADPPPPLYLRMMHPTIPSLFFIGLFQPIGCIWRLADYQARIAAAQLTGALRRAPDIESRVEGDPTAAGIEVDYHVLRRQLLTELRMVPRAAILQR